MPGTDIAQQSLGGTILRLPVTLIKFLLTTIKHILLLPYYLVKSLVVGVKKIVLFLLPEFYGENLFHSFQGLLCAFLTLFIIASFVLIVFLTPVYLLGLAGAAPVFKNFDLVQGLIVMGKAIIGVESTFFALAVGGFLLSFLVAFLSITIYTPIQLLGEWLDFLTNTKVKVVSIFAITCLVFGVLFLIVTGKIPL